MTKKLLTIIFSSCALLFGLKKKRRHSVWVHGYTCSLVNTRLTPCSVYLFVRLSADNRTNGPTDVFVRAFRLTGNAGVLGLEVRRELSVAGVDVM